MRRALSRFLLLSLVAMALVVLATLGIAERVARDQALDDAREQGAGVAERLVAPLVDEDVRARTPGAADQLTAVMAARMRDGSVRHVKVWDVDGVVIWSDQQEMVGRRFALTQDVAALFGTRGVTAELSGLDRPENLGEREERELLEVYVGTTDRTGEPLVVEAYLSTAPMEENTRAIVATFVPLIVGSLVLLLLLVVPLAVSLSRQVHRAHAERAVMMRHALLASDLEQRRMAEELHHGVVQDLSGLVYALPTVGRHLGEGGDLDAARSMVVRATRLIEQDVAALRSLMTGVYPPDLDRGGLPAAVRQLVATCAGDAGLRGRVSIPDDLVLPSDAARLAYRVVREGVRNVVKHAAAEEVVIEVAATGLEVVVRVLDDGAGPGPRPPSSPTGHLGLRLLTDTVRDFGGRLTVGPRPGGGTELAAVFPTALVRG